MSIMNDGLLWTLGLPRYGYGTFFRLKLGAKYRPRVKRP
jgi:hypothetical protein